MNVRQLLEERVSIAQLDVPAPSAEVLERAIRAAARAPDHKQLRPFRFLTIAGEARHRLGELFVRAAQSDDPLVASEDLKKPRNMPLRAPLIIVGIARLQEHRKVPFEEQRITAGVAVMNLMLSLRGDGFGSMWRTGPFAYHPVVKQGLGLADHEEIVGFIYIGTPSGKVRAVPDVHIEDFLQNWADE